MLLSADQWRQLSARAGQSRTIKSPKDSILHPLPRMPSTFGKGCATVDALRSTEADPEEPPTVSELEEAWGEAVGKCDLFARNWRNRIYRIELADGSFVFGKIAGHRDAAMLRCQNKQLRVPDGSDVPGLRVLNRLRCCPQSD
jgi:hypothetical protein